jgi:hypothetical protein
MMRNMGTEALSAICNEGFPVLDDLAREFEEAFKVLSDSAERELAGKAFVFNRYGREQYPCFETTDADLVPGCIFPIKEGRPVASVDSTCILVGETSQGALFASRTAVGMSYQGSLRRFFRLGPILVYATGSGLTGLGSEVSSTELDLILSDHAVAERFIRNTIERRVILALSSKDDTILMADGSLRHPMGLKYLSGPSRRGKVTLVGFSKSSNLILSEDSVASLSNSQVPSYHIIDDGPVKTALAKFTADGLVFRLDLTGPESPEITLGRILWNDAFASGYPDSLKVAHHLSIFSRAEDQALKAYVTQRFRVRQVHTFPLRKIALGSFRGGA